MLIQYTYAVATMLPCPLWFWYKYMSAFFLISVFCWSVYNGATYYIDVFGNRFQKELEALKAEVAKMNSPDHTLSPLMTPKTDGGLELDAVLENTQELGDAKSESVENIPLLAEQVGSSSIYGGAKDVAKERKVGELPP